LETNGGIKVNDLISKMLSGLDDIDFHIALITLVDVARTRGYTVQIMSDDQLEPTKEEIATFFKHPIAAIKDYRYRTGSTWKDSKDRLEAAAGRIPKY
jgi:hypothetical protein